MDKLKSYALQQLVRNAANNGQLQRAARYTPPPAPVRSSGGGLKSGSPVNTPSVNRGITNTIRSAPVYTPPPPPTISERVAAAFNARPDARQQLAGRMAPVVSLDAARSGKLFIPPNPSSMLPSVTPMTMGFQEVSEEEPEDETWTLYEIPGGQDVAMPSSYVPPPEWQVSAELTDPNAIENARTSPIGWDQQPPEIQAQVQQPGQEPTLSQVWNPETPRYGPEDEVGLDSSRSQQEAQTEQIRDAFTAGRIGRAHQKSQMTTPVTMASDFAREQEQVANQDQAAQRVAQFARMQNVFQQGGRSIPIAQDTARLQQETKPGLPPPPPEPEPEEEDDGGWWGAVEDFVGGAADLAGDAADVVQGLSEEGLNKLRDVGAFIDVLANISQDEAATLVDYMESRAKDGVVYLGGIGKAIAESSDPSIKNKIGAGLKEAVPDWGVPDWIENLEVPGTGKKIADIANIGLGQIKDKAGWYWDNVVVGPQQVGSIQSIEDAYNTITNGAGNTDAGIYETAMGSIVGSLTSRIDSPAKWMLENKNEAFAIYNMGVDTDGDGIPDLTGAEAVAWHWEHNVANATQNLLYELVSDPWNATMIGGGLLGAADDALRAGRIASPIVTGIIRGAKTGIKVLEGAGSFGLEYAPDIIGAVVKKTPVLKSLFSASDNALKEFAMDGFDEASEGLGDLKRLPVPETREITDLTFDNQGIVNGVKLADDSTLSLTPQQGKDLTDQLSITDKTSSATRAMADSLRQKGVGIDDVPPRYLKPIDAIVSSNPTRIDDINRTIQQLTPGMKHHVVAMNLTYGTGRSFPDAAIDTSRATKIWREAFPSDLDLPDYVPSTPRQSDHYVDAEMVIHSDWDSAANREARARLYRTVGTDHGMSKRVGTSDASIVQAERYADLITEHLRWNPDALSNPGFERAYREAQEIRAALANRGVRPRNSYSRRATRNTGTKTPGVDTSGPGAADNASGGGSPSRNRGTSTGESAPLAGGSRGIPLKRGEQSIDEINGYPVIRTAPINDGSGVIEEVRVSENVTVQVRETLDAFDARARNGITKEIGDWLEAPTREEALDRAIADATAKGWMDEVPASATPTTTADAAVPAPDAPAAIPTEPTPPTPTQTAVTRGVVATDTALDNPRRLYRWDDDDFTEAVDLLDTARVGAPAITPAQLNTAGGRGLMNDVNNILDKRKAIAIQDRIAANLSSTPKAKQQAQLTTERLRKEIADLERRIGVTDGPTRTRIQKTGSVVPEPRTKQAKQYAKDIERLTDVRHMPRRNARGLFGSRSGMVVDEGGLAYLSTPFGDVPLTPDQLAELTKHTFEGGDTSLDRWIKYINADHANPKLTAEQIIENARLKTRADLEKMLTARFPAKQPGLLMKLWNKYTEYLRNQILGSWISLPRYWSNTTFGNMSNLVLGGYGADAAKVLNVRQIMRNAQDDLRNTINLLDADHFIHNPEVLSMDRIANTFGTHRAPEIRRQIRTDTTIGDETPIEAWFSRNGIPRPFKGTARAITGDSRGLRIALGMDMQMRDVVYTTAFNRQARDAVSDFRKAAKTQLTTSGLSPADADDAIKRFMDAHPTGFSMADVQKSFTDYLPSGLSDRLARDWQAAVNRIDKHARAELRRVTFAGTQTKLDEALRPFIMFNYFMSRQYAFFIKQGLSHPGLVISYLEWQEFTERYIEENPDMPRWAKGLMRISVGDMSLLVNPMALYQIGSMFTNGVQMEDFNETGFEKHFDWLTNSDWFFLHPGISNGLNLFGFLGDDRAFDPLNMGTWGRWAQVGENWLRLKGMLGDDEGIQGNRVNDTGNAIRDWFSGKFDWLPGQDHIELVESVGTEEAELRAIAWDEAEQQGRDPEHNIEDREWLDAQMADPNSDLYKQAFKRYLTGESVGLAAKMVPLVASFQPIQRPLDKDNKDLMESIKLRGNEEMKQFVRTNDPEARAIDLAADKYYALGDEHPYANNDIYTEIAYGDPQHAVILDGVYYSADDIKRMSPDERTDLARAWLAEEGVYSYWQDYQEAEQQFLADPDNRAFAQNKSWQREVYAYDGGVEGYWEALIKENPNARRYYEGLSPDLTEEERTAALTNRWAFMSVAGMRGNIYEPVPLETNFFDPVDIANKAPQAIPYEEYVSDFEKDTRKQVEKYESEMTRADPIVKRILSDWGVDPNTPFNQYPYKFRMDVMDEYEHRTGDNLPWEESDNYWAADRYWKWTAVQPIGADTSLEAYFEAGDEDWENQMPSSFNNSYTDARDDVESEDWYDDYRNIDPGYRWEDED